MRRRNILKKINDPIACRYWVKYCGILFLLFSSSTYISAFLFVDFDQSMQKEKYMGVLAKNHCWQSWYDQYKDFYYTLQQVSFTDQEIRIPKKIHQIWLGGSLPEQFIAYQQSWISNHPDWEYHLWTDEDVLQFNFLNRDLFDEARNLGEKSDIWRYEILLQEGGVYVDVDFECIKPLDELHALFDFYAGIQPLDTGGFQLGIGLIGCKKQHPLMLVCMYALRKIDRKSPIILRTGPLFFTHVVCNYLKRATDCLINAVLPASYFYPRNFTEKFFDRNCLKSESFAVHHWAGSWLPSSFVHSN